jgi:hypothetical protein
MVIVTPVFNSWLICSVITSYSLGRLWIIRTIIISRGISTFIFAYLSLIPSSYAIHSSGLFLTLLKLVVLKMCKKAFLFAVVFGSCQAHKFFHANAALLYGNLVVTNCSIIVKFWGSSKHVIESLYALLFCVQNFNFALPAESNSLSSHQTLVRSLYQVNQGGIVSTTLDTKTLNSIPTKYFYSYVIESLYALSFCVHNFNFALPADSNSLSSHQTLVLSLYQVNQRGIVSTALDTKTLNSILVPTKYFYSYTVWVLTIYQLPTSFFDLVFLLLLICTGQSCLPVLYVYLHTQIPSKCLYSRQLQFSCSVPV